MQADRRPSQAKPDQVQGVKAMHHLIIVLAHVVIMLHAGHFVLTNWRAAIDAL